MEIELSDKLYQDLSSAARNLKMTRKRFVITAIRQMATSNQLSQEQITASLNKFFEENPDLNNIEATRYWQH
jgi:predicted transcriptional regulator